jgi:hypothetical protein
MAYLDDHPPARSQFRCPRRAQPSGTVVVHTSEQRPDTSGNDGGAESNARFTASRTDKAGSYHDICDSQNRVQLVRYECEAFHCATLNMNWHSYGVSFATQADLWDRLPPAYVEGLLRQGALAARNYAHWVRARRGIVIPARRVTVAQARAGVPGFIGHGELDPARRTDPTGPRKVFPWDRFLAYYAGQPPEEDDLTPEELQQGLHKFADTRLDDGALTQSELQGKYTNHGILYLEARVNAILAKLDEIEAKLG